MNIHIFPTEDSGEIYDISQTADHINDGDILVCMTEGTIAIMVEAWPVRLYEYSEVADCKFESTAPEVQLVEMDGGKYLRSVTIAGGIKMFNEQTENWYYPHHGLTL